MESVKNLTPGGDHNVWVIKGDDPVEAEIHKEIRIELASEEDAADEQQLVISVSVDADDEPAGDHWRCHRYHRPRKRANKEEIEAAVSAIAGDAKSIDVEVLSTKD